MAKGGAVWGIDIGRWILKAIRCRPHEKEPRRLVVESFDYIEYPKILTQPEAEPAELIREALETFLARNELVGDTVAMSVGGQNGLMRFIKLPPSKRKRSPTSLSTKPGSRFRSRSTTSFGIINSSPAAAKKMASPLSRRWVCSR